MFTTSSPQLVIMTEGVKRAVPLPCAMCLSLTVARQIRDAMNQFIGSESAFGWVTVHTDEAEDAGSNSKPMSWREPA